MKTIDFNASKKLSQLQAFLVMRNFLDHFYWRTLSDDVGSLLGDLQLFPEGGTWDPAAWGDWVDSIHEVVGEKELSNLRLNKIKIEQNLTVIQAFCAMREFLKSYFSRTTSDDVAQILHDPQILANGKTANPLSWQDWLRCVDEVLKGNIL